jgi:alpha-glucosidase
MFWKYVKEGVPMLKSLVYYDQEDNQTHFRTDEFIFGEQILVCPIQEPNAKGRRMYIPRGRWYNYWNNDLVDGGSEKWVEADIDQIPMFVKEGAIIPKYPLQQYVGEKKIEQLTLDVYYKSGIEQSTLYEDAQDGYDYRKGEYSVRNFRFNGKDKELIIQQFKDGSYITPYTTIYLNIIGLPFNITRVQVDNEEVSLAEVRHNGDNAIVVPKNFSVIHIFGN